MERYICVSYFTGLLAHIAVLAAMFSMPLNAGELSVGVIGISETCTGEKPTVKIRLQNTNASFGITGITGSIAIRQPGTTFVTQSIGTHTLAPSQTKEVDVDVEWAAPSIGTYTAMLTAQGADNINGPQSATRTFSVCPSTPCPQRPTASASAIYLGSGTTGSVRYSVAPESCCFEIKATVVTGRNVVQNHSPDTWVAVGASRDVSVTVNRAELGKGSTVLRVDWRACNRSSGGSDYLLVLDGTESAPKAPEQPAGVSGGQVPMSGTGADPVITANREMHVPVTVVDAEVIAELPIRFNRDYLSQLEKVRPSGSGLGPNWSHSYDYAAARTGNISVVLRPNGAEAVFNRSGDRWDLAYPKSEPLSFGVEGDSIARMVDNSTGVVYEFEQFGQLSGVGLTNGYMNRIRWETPTFLTIKTPSGKGILLTTDSLGRFTTISNGVWTSSYHYNTGFLVQFRNPFPETHTTQYVYQRGKPYMTSWVTPMGRTPLTIAYDDQGRVTSQDLGEGEIYRFSGGNGTTVIQFPTGEQVTHGHDAMNRLTSIKRPDGEATFTYDANGNRTSVTDFSGGRTNRTFLRGLSRGSEYANGGGFRINYGERSANGLTLQDIEKVEVIGGGSTIYGRDAISGVVNLITRSGRGSTAFEYAPNSHLPSRVQDFGIDTRYTWNADGLPATLQFRDGETLTYEYNEFNYPTRIVSSKSERTQTMTWDPMGLLRSRTYGGATERFEYDGDFLLRRFTDAVGNVTRWSYDDRGRLEEFQQPATAPLQISWKGLDVSRTQLGDYGVDYSWSWDKQSVTMTDNNRLSRAIIRNEDGIPTTITLPGDRDVKISTNAMGWTSGVLLPSGLGYDFGYNNTGDVTEISGPIRDEQLVRRNADGTSYEHLIGGRVRLQLESSFTGRDRLNVRLTDGDGFDWSSVVDGESGRLTLPSGKSITTSYDAIGHPLGIAFGEGIFTDYGYTNGSLTSITTESDSMTVRRDAAGRVMDVNSGQISRDSAGRITRAGTTVATYNADGTRKDLSWGAGLSVQYGFENGRLTSVRDYRDGETQVRYNDYGLLAGYRFPDNFELNYEYNVDGHVRKVSTSDGWSMDYTYENGRVASIIRSDTFVLFLPMNDRSYRYTSDNQLEGADYDARGNITNNPGDRTAFLWGLFGPTRFDSNMETHRFQYNEFGILDRIEGGSYNVGIRADLSVSQPLPLQIQYNNESVEDVITALGRVLYTMNASGDRSYVIDDGFGNVVATRAASGTYANHTWYTPFGESVTGTASIPSLRYGGVYGDLSIGDVRIRVQSPIPDDIRFNSPLDEGYQRRLNFADRYRRELLDDMRSPASVGHDPGLTTVTPAVASGSEPFSPTTKLRFDFANNPNLSLTPRRQNDETFSATTKLKGEIRFPSLGGILDFGGQYFGAPVGSEFASDHDKLIDLLFGDDLPPTRVTPSREPQVDKAAPTTTTQIKK